MDPHTGQAPDGSASVTGIGRHLSDVDAYATAAFAMGTAGCNWINDLAGHSGFGVNEDGTTWTTS